MGLEARVQAENSICASGLEQKAVFLIQNSEVLCAFHTYSPSQSGLAFFKQSVWLVTVSLNGVAPKP